MSNQMNNTTDRDSLMALDALLRIRESCEPPKKVNTVEQDKISAAAGYTSTSANALSSLLGLTGPTSRLMLPRVSNGFPHLAAVQCAAWGAASPFSLHKNVTNVQHQEIVPKPAAGTENKEPMGSPKTNTSSSRKSSDEDSDDEDAVVRKEKVEAALRSKPQRGKKRDDLSDKERLELTRTRNREHAKSTRIRKKARYQELLDREEMFLAYTEAEELKSRRCQTFQNFLSIRQGMVSQFEDNSSRGAGEHLISEKVEYDSLLSEVVEDISKFSFDAKIPGMQSDTDCGEGMTRMKVWDKAVSTRVSQSFGTNSVRSLMYKISGGTNGIAQSKDDHAVARVDLISPQSSESPDITVLSGMLTVRFAPQSSCLAQVSWVTLEDHCTPVSDSHHDVHRHQTIESLRHQLIHPSVVSLDHHTKTTDGSSEDLSHGPGMHI